MKSNNLELELRRYELSAWNDKITYEKHYYNGFSGMKGTIVYQTYLEGLYINYFIELRNQIDKLIFISTDTLLNFLKTKIDLFNEINDIGCNYCLRWADYKNFENLINRDETIDKPILERSQEARNDYATMKFFREMIGTQLYFIERGINELTQLYNNYNPQSQPQKITDTAIDKETWTNTLKDEKEIIDTFDLARIFNKKESTIRRWAREGVIVPIDKNKRPLQFKKDEIKKYYLKLKEK